MPQLVQTIIVAAIIAAAAAYLGWTFWKTILAKKKGGCGCASEGGCPKAVEMQREMKRASKVS